MTVCIAAICSPNVIVGAADRLITYGDTEYDQATPKILQLASNTVALTSGSPEAHVAIRAKMALRVATLTNPTVEQIAEAYADEFANLRRRRAERRHLTPLGLTTWTFLNNQTNLTSSAAQHLMELLSSEDLASEAIIAGVDQTGPHLYVIDDPGEAICYDMDAWAAIGSGFRHADQQFIHDKYNREWPFDEAFLLTYLAKKRADITPGVGGKTDMFWIGQGPDAAYTLLPSDAPIVEYVEKLYKDIAEKEEEMIQDAREQISKFISGEIEKQQEGAGQGQVEEIIEEASGGGADDETGVRGGAEEGQSEG